MTGRRIDLDARAVVGGNLGVIEWLPDPLGVLSTPIVAINPMKTVTPTRYVDHETTCTG